MKHLDLLNQPQAEQTKKLTRQDIIKERQKDLVDYLGEDLTVSGKYSNIKKKNRECSLYGILTKLEIEQKTKDFCEKMLKGTTNGQIISYEYQRVYVWDINNGKSVFQIVSSENQHHDPEKQDIPLQIYNRKILIYDTQLINPLKYGVTVKKVIQIQINDNKILQTTQIWKDLQEQKLIELEQYQFRQDDKQKAYNPMKYTKRGTEYKFCMTDFPDIRELIFQYKLKLNPDMPFYQLTQIDKNYMCSLHVFKIYYDNRESGKSPGPHDQTVDTEINVMEDEYYQEEMLEKYDDDNTAEDETVSKQYVSYAELKGYCMDSEQELYSKLLERFSQKFQGVGLSLMMGQQI